MGRRWSRGSPTLQALRMTVSSASQLAMRSLLIMRQSLKSSMNRCINRNTSTHSHLVRDRSISLTPISTPTTKPSLSLPPVPSPMASHPLPNTCIPTWRTTSSSAAILPKDQVRLPRCMAPLADHCPLGGIGRVISSRRRARWHSRIFRLMKGDSCCRISRRRWPMRMIWRVGGDRVAVRGCDGGANHRRFALCCKHASMHRRKDISRDVIMV